MLHRIAFHLAGEVVSLHMDNSMVEVYLCNQGGTESSFVSRLAYCILNLANRHGSTLPPAYTTTLLNVEVNYLSWERLVSEWHLLPHKA